MLKLLNILQGDYGAKRVVVANIAQNKRETLARVAGFTRFETITKRPRLHCTGALPKPQKLCTKE